MTYKPLFFSLVILFSTNAFCQAPVITHVDKYINGNNQRVTISGSNFGGNPANLSIWFGAAKATTIQTATDQTIEVLVPPGATYESITVTNTSTNQTAYSAGEFQLSFGGSQPITLANLVAQTDLNAESGLFDVCLCDLDNDGLNDVGTANSGGSSAPTNSVALFRNTSTAGSFSFASKTSLIPSVRSLHIRCGDLDGDGKKDLVVTEADPGNRVFILKNTSTTGSLSFTSQTISVVGKSPKRIEIVDLDLDGKPDVVLTDQKSGNNNFIILPNTSSGASISFGTPIFIAGPAGASSTDGLAVQDLDGDNRPDIVVNQFLSANSNIFIYRNQSTAGNFRFDNITTLQLSGTPVSVRVGDIDGDSKADIVATQLGISQLSVFINQCTTGQIKFSEAKTFATDLVPWGVDLGDLDGDGKLDIVVASLTGPGTTDPKSLTILNNTSTPGSVSFLPNSKLITGNANRHTVIGDIDGDSKPDITYTKVDDVSRNITASKVAFYRNKSCIVPKVTPEGPMVVCASFPVTLEGAISSGATYQWNESGTPVALATNSTFTPSLSGNYTLDITSDGCTKTSNAVSITVSAGAATAPSFTNNSPLCEGGTINITASSAGGTAYNWTGPQGFIATGASITRGPYVPEFGGRYEVEVMAGGCIAAKGSALVETISLPAFIVGFTGSDVFCSGTKTLDANPNDINFTYQWADASGDIASATSASFNAGATGSYFVKAKSTLYPGCPEVQSDPVSVTLATTPVIAFDSPVETCKSSPTSFTNQSTVQADAGPVYSWDFGDAGTSTDEDPKHTYLTIGDLTVKLTVSYRGNVCSTPATKPIKISLPPIVTITAPDNVFQICDGDKVTLSVTPDFSDYLWSNSATTSTIDVTEGGTYSVQVKSTIGCKVSASAFVTVLDGPELTVTATPNSINLGESSQLKVAEVYDNYSWSPVETLDNATIQDPVAIPLATTTYTVSVLGSNGCSSTDSVTVNVILADPLSQLLISNFFSPNGDPTNATWNVKPDFITKTCGVTIFDEKGLKVFEEKPYLNDWDGTNNGKKLPDGVYYYIIKCDNGSGAKTGSITILR